MLHPATMRVLPKTTLAIVSFAIWLCLTPGSHNQAQSNPELPTLNLNQPVSASLKGSESHGYKLHAEARMFVRLMVMQQGVNVLLSAHDSSGQRLTRVDDHYGRVGPQLLEFVAETSGDYVVRVGGVIDEQGGKYEITYFESRPATNDDRLLVTANNHINAGRELRGRPSTEGNPVALREYEAAQVLFRQINNVSGQATALEHAGRIYEAQSFYQKALETFASALQLSQ